MTSKLEKFLDISQNEANNETKISRIYKSEYDDSIEHIFNLQESDFKQKLSKNIHSIIANDYPKEIFQNQSFLSIIKKYDNLYLNTKYQEDKSSFLLAIKNSPKGEPLQYSFRKHCVYQESCIIHHCSSNPDILSDKFICVNNNQHIICAKCHACYLSSCIKLYCTFCSLDYFTSLDIEGNLNNNDLQPATWEKYHCNIIYNDQMHCVKCKVSSLLLDIKKNLLICKNEKCKAITEPRNILWKCAFCNQEFKSNAKIYNPLEYKMVKKVVKDSLIEKQLAMPKIFPCGCKDITAMKHKKNCNGILYLGKFYDRDMAVCAKCNSMTYVEKFIWTCPNCGKRFRDNDNTKLQQLIEEINSYNSPNEEENFNNIFNKSTNETDCNVDNLGNFEGNKSISLSIPIKMKNSFKNIKMEIPEISTDNYDIISQITEGANAKVYACKEVNTMCFYALKKINFPSEPKNYIAQLENQNVFSKINPNIMSIIGIHYDKNLKELNIIEELAINDLEKEIYSLAKTRKFYKEKEIISLLSQITNACVFLQNQGFVHWNIMPCNIFQYSGKIFKLGNFKELRSLKDLPLKPKKEKYFSDPSSKENISGKTIEDLAKLDVFCLGLCILYLISMNIQTIIDIQHFWSTKKNIVDYNEKVKNIIDKALAKNYPQSNKLPKILVNMLLFTIRKRFDFVKLSEYLESLNSS